MSVRAIFIFIGAISSFSVFADVAIFDSRRPVALSDDEKPPRDYYINGGSEQGLKPGLIVTVSRRMALYDSFENRSPGELVVQVGKIKIIHVQKGLSVARFYSYPKNTSSPSLDDNFIMVGDKLDLSTVEVDKGDKRAEAASEVKGPVVAAAVAPPAPVVAKTVTTEMSSKSPEVQKPIAVPQVQ